MKHISLLFISCLFFLFSFAQSNDDIQRLVLEAEKQWNAGNPDKSFMSAGNSIDYGLGYLKKNKFTESLWYFDEVIKKEASHAYAQLFAGLANVGLQQFQLAEANFSKLESISPALAEQAKTLLQKAKQDAAKVVNTKPSETKAAPVKQTKTTAAKPEEKKSVEPPGVNTEKKGGSLVYGDYVFTLDYWDVSQKRMVHQQKGFFTLKANGTYTYMGTTGKYSYQPTTGIITWQSGTFKNMGKNTTIFQRNKTTCEIDFEYHTANGSVYYSGGRNL